MHLVIKHGDEFATTSEIIASSTDTQHKNVLELVGTYKPQIEQFGRVAFETRTFETNGGRQKREIAILNEQQATFLLTLMRNSEVVVRFKVELVKEFYRMRSLAPTPLVPQTLSEALRLAADLADQKEKMAEQLAIAAPKVTAYDRIATVSDGSMCITNAAKALQVQPKKLFQYMSENKWIYRRAGAKSWTAYQDRLQSGLLEAKVSTVEKTDGSERVVENTHVTAKGLARLAAAFGVTINQDDLFQGAAA